MKKKLLLTLISILLVGQALRNFSRLSGKSIPLHPIEISIKGLIRNIIKPTKLAYFSNTIDDGLYFKSQLIVAPHILTKFGNQDTALFIRDMNKKDTLFKVNQMGFSILDSAQSENIKAYLLIRP